MNTDTPNVDKTSKEHKNDLARKRRFRKHHQHYESRMHGIISAFDRAAKEHWTHDRLLKYRSEWLSTAGMVGWVVDRLYGVWDTCSHLHDRKTEFCYPHPDTGELRPAKELCKDGLASRLNSDAGCRCYINDDDTYTDIYYGGEETVKEQTRIRDEQDANKVF